MTDRTVDIAYATKPTDRRFRDLTGQTFGRLTVLGFAGKFGDFSYRWWCECECGVVKTVDRRQLTQGATRSCGCYRREAAGDRVRLDITGEKYGMLTAVRSVGPRGKDGATHWFCECECGGTTEVHISHLRSGDTKSCGCLNGGRLVCVTTHGMTGTPEYMSYLNAKNRCENPNVRSYPDYGGRGITLRFKSFEDFYAELGDRPTPKHTLDRIDNSGHYEPGNVRWATRAEQNRNRRNNRRLTHQGETMTMVAWADRVGIDPQTIRQRIDRGWCPACSLAIPSGEGACPHHQP